MKFLIACSLLCALLVNAECPNGCSGRGTCSSKDMCACYKNFEGNDCSMRTCPHGYAHIDTPKGDLNMDLAHTSTTILTNSQRWPAGIYEFYNPAATSQEGHFYAECSNRGLCDHETGDCVCFEAYTGSSCQRTVCPNDCSGRGTCESISEFATSAAGDLFHTGVVTGDTTYGLWDEKISYGCKCDPGFYGPDCSLRRCKVGVDPLYEALGTEALETIQLSIHILDASTDKVIAGTSYIRIRFFDYWGESYITKRILIDAATMANTATNVATAFTDLPNGVIPSVTCEAITAISSLSNILTYAGATSYNVASDYVEVGCQFTGNPGKHRIAEIAESNIDLTGGVTEGSDIITIHSTTIKGEDADYCNANSATTITTLANQATTMTTSGTPEYTPSVTAPILLRVRDQYLLSSAVSTVTTTLLYEANVAAIASGTQVFSYCTTALARETQTIDAIAVGSKTLTMNVAPSDVAVGTTVFFENQFFTIVAISGVTITLDRSFAGNADESGPIATGATDYLYYFATDPTTSYTYVSECSGRGICDSESGVCQCFKGYTNDNCDTQNIMSF